MAQSNNQYTRPTIPNETPINAKILYSGVLMKKGEYHKGWKERWFVLFDNRQLSYYHNREEFQDSKRPINSIDLKQVTAIQPVATTMTPQSSQSKKSKKSSFIFRTNSERSQSHSQQIQRSQSLHSPMSTSGNGNISYNNGRPHTYRGGYHTEDSDIENSTTMTSITNDSPIPTLPQQNSLRMSFKSLMGKKSKEKKNPDLNLSASHSNSRFLSQQQLQQQQQQHNGGGDNYDDDYSRNDSFQSLDGGSDLNDLQINAGSSGNISVIFNAEFPFEMVTPSRTYLLCSLDAYSFNDWLENLRNVTIGKKIYGGWLTKQGSKNKSWEKLWFVIFDTREIRYYETEKASQEKGSIILDDLQIMNLLDDKNAKSMYKKKNVFELVCGGRKWVLVANSKEERV